MRTALTMFGVFWGTCSIVLLFAFGKGITEQQIKDQKGMGDNIAIIWPGVTSMEFQGLPTGRRIRPTEDDVVLIKKKSSALSAISPEYRDGSVTIKFKKESRRRSLFGVWPEFGDMRNIIPDEGSRFINERDMAEKRRVVFIGNRLKEDIFGEEEAVGERVLIDNMPFTVIGVMKVKKQNSSYSGRDYRNAYIPSSTFQSMYSRRYVNNVVVQTKPEISMEVTKSQIFEIMGAKYKFDPTDRETLSIWDTTKGIAFLKDFFRAFRYFLIGIGIATLITGGIGVSNIMNIVLEERTKEIGIKMALGAKKGMILFQFIFETLIITGVGGVFGFLFAYGIVKAFPLLQLGDFVGTPSVDVWGSVMVIFVLGIVGLVAGYFPAKRAANLQPVQALKLF